MYLKTNGKDGLLPKYIYDVICTEFTSGSITYTGPVYFRKLDTNHIMYTGQSTEGVCEFKTDVKRVKYCINPTRRDRMVIVQWRREPLEIPRIKSTLLPHSALR